MDQQKNTTRANDMSKPVFNPEVAIDRRADKRRKTLGFLLGLLLSVGMSAFAQQTNITPNYKDADIRQIIEAVAEVTGKNFIIDPRVNANNVNMYSTQPLSPEAFYEAFLSILQVYGYVAVPAGDVIKIVPDSNARQMPTPESSGAPSDKLETRVVSVKNVGAAQLVPILRPLVPQYGHLAAHPASNMLIITDRSANVNRLVKIIRRIDRAGDEDIVVIPLQHATASEVVRILSALQQSSAQAGGQPPGTNLVADERTNSILVSGDKDERLRMRALIAHLDTPLEDGGNTRVRYLLHADAVELAEKLKEQVGNQPTTPQQGAGGQLGAGQVIIWADEPTNALIVTAPPKIMRSLMTVVDKLDIRRPQVWVQAIIVEVTSDKAAELGISWIVDGTNDNNIAAVTNFGSQGPGVVQFGQAVAAGGDQSDVALDLIPDGITLGVGRISDSGTSIVAIIRALASDGDTNIISTPSIITIDNEEAEIKVAQEVPFRTGQFTNTGAAGTAVNPFTTIQREEVGTILKITPQISEGNAIRLKIEQETSSIAQGVAGAADLITNKRTINTNVIVDDGGIIVLGGLIEDTLLESESRVPVLGSMPIIGPLFRAKSTSKVKTNLMVFIQPRILRDAEQTALETNEKYNYMRNLQIGARQGVPLMRNESRPILQELFAPPPPMAPAPGTGAAKGTKTEDGADGTNGN